MWAVVWAACIVVGEAKNDFGALCTGGLNDVVGSCCDGLLVACGVGGQDTDVIVEDDELSGVWDDLLIAVLRE